MTATPNPGVAGHSITLGAAVRPTSGSRVPTGTVSFTDASAPLGSTRVAANGTAAISVVLAPGPHAIAAAYSGDANDAPSPSNNLPVEVDLATTSVAVTSGGSPAIVLSPITFTAAVTGNGGTPGGTIVFSIDGAAASPVTLDATGKASYSSSSLAVGSHIVAATYSGDANDNGSTSSGFTQAVQAISTSTTLATASSGGTTPQTILVAAVAAGASPIPTGTVVFKNDSTAIGTATVDANGAATLLPDLAPATYNITAEYSGDAIHSASTSSAVKVTGTPIGFGMTISPATVSMAATQNTTVTVTFQSNNGYADSIGLGCGTLPMGITCHFGSNTIDLKAGGTSSIHLTIDTSTPLGAGASAMNSAPRAGRFSLAGLFLPAGLLFGWIGWRFRKRNSAFFTALVLLAMSGAVLVTGCGGFTQKSVKPGTYTIQVTAVGAGSNVSHYQTITLTITK